jgi:hypothetical protein
LAGYEVIGRMVGIIQPLIIAADEKSSYLYEMTRPMCQLSSEAGQLLMDDLWQAGLRPSEGTGSAGAFKAVQNHLSDMRKIAFKFLKVEEK